MGSVLIILILILTREVEGSAKIVRGVAKERVHIRSYTRALRTQEGHTILHTQGVGRYLTKIVREADSGLPCDIHYSISPPPYCISCPKEVSGILDGG